MKRFISVLLALALMVPVAALPAYAKVSNEFIITNPYDGVDWNKWGKYKTQLHCHTTASDGYQTIQEAIRDYYALDYDVVAITDHGTLNKGWNTEPDTVPIMRAIKKERTGGARATVYPVSDEEYEAYTDGTMKSVKFSYMDGDKKVTTSRKRTHKNGMLDVPKGVELNMATPVADCHLTGYFSDYGQGLAGVYGDYETPSKGVRLAGGLSMLAHIGEYVYTDKDSYDHVGQKVDEYYVNKFARIFLDNAGSSVGMGINSATDAHTRCDRILYDQILQKTIPNGVVPWGFTFSDSHSDTSINDAYTVMCMPELTNDALKNCMLNGQFFSVSHYSNGFELNGMQEMEGYLDENWSNVEWWKDNTPKVTKIVVDEKKDVIKVWGENFNYITWVSDGNVILRDYDCKDGYAEIDLHSTKLLDKVNMFVRFYLSGDNGICYAQPMVVQRKGETFTPVDVPKTRDVSTRLRTLVTVLDWALFKWNPIIWIFKYFALGYNPFRDIINFDNVLSIPPRWKR